MKDRKTFCMLTLLAAAAFSGLAGDAVHSRLVFPGPDGRLAYAENRFGDTIPDYSNSGYGGGGVPLPNVPVVMTLKPQSGSKDDTERIQSALDQLAEREPDSNGMRGALLLEKGVYRVSGTLRMASSGMVLRGEGPEQDGTVLFATGRKSRSLISAGAAQGLNDPAFKEILPIYKADGGAPCREIPGSRRIVTDERVPAGARSLTLNSADGFSVGDPVVLVCHANDAWVHELGMDDIPKRPDNPAETKNWKASEYQIGYFRTVTAVDRDRVTLDAPVVCAIERRWGGGELFRFQDERIYHVGVESLRIVSEFDPSVVEKGNYADESKCKTGVYFDGLRDGWICDVTGVHLDRLATLDRTAQRVTVQDCAFLDPVSKVTGGRRYAFAVQGQQCLIQRCFAQDARHAFVFGSRAPGPNVFLDCLSVADHNSSEPHHRWSTGGLYDNVSAPISIINRGWYGSGHGWTAADFTAWNTEGELAVQSPPIACNYAIGHVGARGKVLLKEIPDGVWESDGVHVQPRSLYLAQLRDRLGEKAVEAVAVPAQLKGSVYDLLLRRYSSRKDRSWGAGARPEMQHLQAD